MKMKLVLDLSYGAASFVMPNLLSKLGADVLSINPYAQTPGMISIDRPSSEERVADAVRTSGADLGAVIDAGGEHLTLIDGSGRVLTHDQALMVFLELMTVRGSDTAVRVALPMTVSAQALELCAGAWGRSGGGTPLPVRPMEAAASGDVAFATDQRGGSSSPPSCPPLTRWRGWSNSWLCCRSPSRRCPRSSIGCRPCRSSGPRWPPGSS